MERLDLILLREIFRKRFDEVDFCIGQERVEELFRQLLDEPEPETVRHKWNGKGLSSQELDKILAETFTADKLISLFERDSALYDHIKKR